MLVRLIAIAVLVVGGCGGDDGDPVDLTQLGAACMPDDSCPSGLTCLTYTGFAGNELKSCEIACPNGDECPASTTCVVISDGPGEVCRAE